MNSPEQFTTLMPISVLTGFLGSGKTTLLSRLLAHPDMARTAVIINEFGEVGLDNLLVEHAEEDTVLLSSGCVCCTVRGDLIETLKRLRQKVDTGEIPRFERVVLETTGLADPAPILHTLMTDETVVRMYRLDSVIATVDAQHGLRQLDENYEPAKQAAVADRIVLTKTDLVTAADVEFLYERLRVLNPSAFILPVIRGEISPNRVFDAGLYDPNKKTMDVRRWLDEESYRHTSFNAEEDDGHTCVEAHCSHSHHHKHDVVPEKHRHGIDSFCLTFTEPLEWSGLAEAFSLLIQMHGEQLLRIKGLVNVRRESLPIVIHGVQHVFYPPGQLAAWPGDDRRTRIVFIVRDLEAERVRQLFSPFVS